VGHDPRRARIVSAVERTHICSHVVGDVYCHLSDAAHGDARRISRLTRPSRPNLNHRTMIRCNAAMALLLVSVATVVIMMVDAHETPFGIFPTS
jgi:hypothetical protein